MTWDTSLARSVSFTVKVAGVTRPHAEVSWAQDITSDLPDSVTAGGQVSHRTGVIVWAREERVETRTPSPWYRGPYWIPEVGQSVTIDAHDGAGNTHRVFTGMIDTVEGDAFGTRSSKIVADLRGSDKIVRYMALTRLGSPVPAPTGSGTLRRQATTPVWLVHEIARSLGYESVPPAPAVTKLILDAPLQGSTYVYASGASSNARLVTSHRPSSVSLDPVWSWNSDGFGVSDALLEWVPYTGQGTGAGSVGLAFQVYSPHTADALLTVKHADNYTYLRVLGDKSVRVSVHFSGVTTSHTIPTPFSGSGPHRVSVVFRGGGINVRINGATYSFAAPTPASPVDRITLDAGAGSCVAGVQVWHAASLTDHHAPNWAPSARYRYGTGVHGVTLTPSVRDRQARDVLEEYATALLSPLWVDGAGILQVVTGRGLHEQSPSLTVDALNDVSELGYAMAALDHRPTVEVSYEHAHHATPTATTARTTVWEGSTGQLPGDMDAPETDETFIEVPDDEEWINLSDPATMTRLTLDNIASFQSGVGSWWGLAGSVDGYEYLVTTRGSVSVETLTPWSWKVSTYNNVEYGASTEVPEIGSIRKHLHGMGLPVIRAMSHVRYEKRTVAVSTGSSPGVLRHETGKWVTWSSAATDLARWVHDMVSKATPVLENLVVRFDPRLDVGMKITVRAQDVFGVDFEALVLSVDHRPYDGVTMVTARATKVTAYTETINDVDYIHIGQSLAQWEAARSGKTLDQVTADPYIL